MNNHILHIPFVRFTCLILLISLGMLAGITQAANLRIEPAAPIIAVGESIQLTVFGAESDVNWHLEKEDGGFEMLNQANNSINYTAPTKIGQYSVIAKVGKESKDSVNITVLSAESAKQAFSREKSVWEVFTHRNHITAMNFSEDGKFWVGTTEGLEQRDASTGQLQQVFTNYTHVTMPTHFPHYNISAVASDNQGGLWVGTYYGGLIHINEAGESKLFDTDTSDLPNNTINTLVSDGHGGVWIATGFPVQELFLKIGEDLVQNGGSAMPTTPLTIGGVDLTGILFGDGGNPFGGIEPEKAFNNMLSELICAFAERSESDNNVIDTIISSIIGDNSFDIFSGLGSNEFDIGSIDLLSLRSTKSDSLETFLGTFGTNDNSQIDPQTAIDLIFLMFGENNPLTQLFEMSSQGNLAYLSGREGELQVYNTQNSSLPVNFISDIISDGNGGLWIGSYCGLTHYSRNGEWTNKVPDLSGHHVNTLNRDDNNGLWIGLSLNKLAYLNNAGTLEPVDTQHFLGNDSIINDIVSDSSNSVWLATNNVGLVQLDKGKPTIYNTDNSNLPSNTVSTLMNDGKGGLWVGTEGGGLANLSANQWILADSKHIKWPNEIEPNLLDTFVNDIVYDNKGGVWLAMSSSGLSEGGVAHLDKNNQWCFFNTNNSGLPSNDVYALAIIDNNDEDKKEWNGVWIGTHRSPIHEGGLAYLNNNGEWSIFNTSNSDLPSNSINAVEYDGYNGVWISTKENNVVGDKSSIVHYDFLNKKWRIYNPTQSDLPNAHHLTVFAFNHYPTALLNDGNGGVWIGAYRGLAHLHNDDTWTIYEPDEIEQLPTAIVSHLVSDGRGGVWIGLSPEIDHENSQLVHLNREGKWKSYTTSNSKLPEKAITALAQDDSGGIWAATSEGLAHFNYRGEGTLFNTANSGLPNNFVRALASDSKNGLWVESWGLSHLIFSQKSFLCETRDSEEECQKLLESKRAAIIIQAYNQNDEEKKAIDYMGTHIYQTLFAKGYNHDEIYYIAPHPHLDFNGDEVPDFKVVNAPVTLEAFRNENRPLEEITIEHIEYAFAEATKISQKAKTDGVNEEPLLVIFVTHGLSEKGFGKLLLNSSDALMESKFNDLLEDYQEKTGNRVVTIIEACNSGAMISKPVLENRLAITSTDKENLSYNRNFGQLSFTQFYFDNLYNGGTYQNSWEKVDNRFDDLGENFLLQTPLLKEPDTEMAQLCLNNLCGELFGPELLLDIPSLFVIEEAFDLAVQINSKNKHESENSDLIGKTCSNKYESENSDLIGKTCSNNDSVIQVSMSARGPQDISEYNEQGYEINPSFLMKNLTRGENSRWFTRFELGEPGQYNFTFSADYKIRGGIRTTSPTQVTVYFQPCEIHADYDIKTNTLHLPAVREFYNNGEEIFYQADYTLTNIDPIMLALVSKEEIDQKVIDSDPNICLAHFDMSEEKLYVPALDIVNENEGVNTFSIKLKLTPSKQLKLDDLSRIKIICWLQTGQV